MKLPITSYRKASLRLVCGLLGLSFGGAASTYAAARLCGRMKQVVFKNFYYPKGHHHGWTTLPANPSAAFTTPSFHDFSFSGKRSPLDAKKINFANGPQITPFFIGREAEKASFTPYFGQKEQLVICPPILGLEGIGKTQLALQLIEQYGAQYDYIVWISAATAQDIEVSYRQIARELGIKLAFNEDLKKVIRLVEEALKGKRVLYLFDNAPNLKTIHPYCTRGHILITSSNTTATDWTSSHYDAPLALQPLSAASMANMPKAPRTTLVLQGPHSDHFDQNGMFHTIKSKLKALQSSPDGEALLQLVQQLAYLSKHPIPLSFALRAFGSADQEAQTRDRLAAIEKHELIMLQVDSVHMHKVIQRIVRDLYPLTPQQLGNLVVRYVDVITDKLDAASDLMKNFYQQMVPHGEKLLTYLQKQGGQDDDTATYYLQLSSLYRQQGHYPTALKFGEKSLHLFTQTDEKNTPNTSIAIAYNNLGLLYDDQRMYKQATRYYQKALDIYIAAYKDSPHPSLATAYHNLGLAYRNQGLYAQALASYQKALDIDVAVYGDIPHPAIATDYHHLGLVYEDTGDMQTAKQFYAKAAAIEARMQR